jgi:hypothetical protein
VNHLVVRKAVAAPVVPTDQLAPALPTGAAGANGSGTVTFSCDQTADIHDGVTPGGGLVSYTWNIAGVDQTPITVGVNANIITAPTLFQVGSFSPVPTSSRDGRDFTINCAGTGFDGTSDQLALLGWEITGDFDVYCYMDSFTGAGYAYAPAGLMAREATAATVAATPTSRMSSGYRWRSAGVSGYQVKDRATAAASSVAGQYGNGTDSGRWFHMRKRRSGGTDTITHRVSIDGANWQNIGDPYVYTGWSNTLVVGAFTCDLQPTPVTMTARFRDLHYTAGAQSVISKTYTTSTTVAAYVKATDLAGNVSAVSPTVSASGAGVAASIKYHPGIYPTPDNQSYRLNSARMTVIQDFINSISANPLITGISVRARMGGADGILSNFDKIHTILGWLAACSAGPKRLILNCQDRVFAGGTVNLADWFPAAIASDTYVQRNNGFYLSAVYKTWDATAVTALLAQMQFIADEFDDEPLLEAFTIEGESAIDTGGAYTVPADAAHTQQIRMFAALRAMWPTTGLRWYGNFYPSGYTQAIMAAAEQYKIAVGGPDPELRINADGSLTPFSPGWRPVDIAQATVGNQNIGDYQTYPSGQPGWIDYRGTGSNANRIPIFSEVQGLGFPGVEGSYSQTPSSLRNYAVNRMRCNYWVPSTNTDRPAGYNWSDTLAVIASTSGAVGDTHTPLCYLT